MIRLLLLFIPFIFILLPTCFNIGQILEEKIKFKSNKYINIVIGFIAIVGLFQLIYYPAMVLQLSSNYLTITGLIIITFLMILNIKNIRNLKSFYKDKNIWLILIFSLIAFFLYMRTLPEEYWYYDDSFYLSYMYTNSNTDKLFTVQPKTGETIDKISNIYMYQGYYMMGSFFIGVFNIIKSLFNLKFNYLTIIMYFMSAPTFIFMVTSILGLSKLVSKNTKEKILLISLYVFYVIFLPIDSNIYNNLFMTGYSGVFSSLTVIYPLLVYYLINYLLDENSNYKLLSIIFLTLLSYASFHLFNIFIILFSLILFSFIKKRKIVLKHYIIMAFPVLLYVPAFLIPNNIIAFIIQLIIISLFIIYLNYTNIIQKYEDKLLPYIKCIIYTFSTVPFLFSIYFIIKGFSIKCNAMEFINNILNNLFPLFNSDKLHYAHIIITLFYIIILVLLGYAIYKKNISSKEKSIFFFLLLIILVFLNPFCIPFTSTILTSETYNRIIPIIINPLIMFIIINKYVDKIKYKKIIIGMSILFIAIISYTQIKELQYLVNISGKSNKLYRMRERDVIASKKLEEFVEKNNIDEIKMASNYAELRLLNPDVNMAYDRFIVLIPNEAFTKIAYNNAILYFLNKGTIKQEFLDIYNENLYDAIKDLGVNFITINTDCPYLNEFLDNYEPNILCKAPKNEIAAMEHEEDKAIYKELLKNLELVYQTERYKLYYVK